MDGTPTPPFRSDTDLAEAATAGVRFNLAVGDRMAATALQPVARAAWGLVHDPQALQELREAARSAEAALAMTCGMTGERRFLGDVLRYLDGPRRPMGPNDDVGLSGQTLELPEPVQVDLEEAKLLGAAAGAYLRAAAALSEASVLFRVAGAAIALEACGAEEIVDGATAAASAVLEQAAAAYAQAVDLLSRSTISSAPDVALHLDELRLGVRVLTTDAVNLAGSEDGGAPEPEDWEGADEVTDADVIQFFTNRAESCEAKARVMAACAEAVRARAHGLATG